MNMINIRLSTEALSIIICALDKAQMRETEIAIDLQLKEPDKRYGKLAQCMRDIRNGARIENSNSDS